MNITFVSTPTGVEFEGRLFGWTQRLLLLLATVIGLTACATPQQIRWLERSDRVLISPSHSSLSITVLTDTADRAKKPMIDVVQSYAVHAGQRYSLRVEDNAYANSFSGKQLVKNLHLDNTLPPTQGFEPINWGSGEWLVHLAFKGGSPMEPIRLRFQLSTFVYVFPFHGAPN